MTEHAPTLCPTMYTAQRIRRDETLYGPSHGSKDGDTTLCGLPLTWQWYITDNTFTGAITCKKCLKRTHEVRYDRA